VKNVEEFLQRVLTKFLDPISRSLHLGHPPSDPVIAPSTLSPRRAVAAERDGRSGPDRGTRFVRSEDSLDGSQGW
jgi:hypothetical protein